jgi:hypothetical protein
MIVSKLEDSDKLGLHSFVFLTVFPSSACMRVVICNKMLDGSGNSKRVEGEQRM